MRIDVFKRGSGEYIESTDFVGALYHLMLGHRVEVMTPAAVRFVISVVGDKVIVEVAERVVGEYQSALEALRAVIDIVRAYKDLDMRGDAP